jgi:histidyl-tRNA synthetase
MSSILPVKGTRDFFPEDMAFRQWLYAKIRDVSQTFGYQEFEAPFIERIDLYAAKSGQELVNEQSFVFEDKSGEMVALRPELTPSLARMIATRSRALPKPIRWWSFGPFWRYERPQKGRTREFFQWNIDLLGVDSPQADAELLAVIAFFFKNVGLAPSQIRILVNNRRLADQQLQSINIPSNKNIEIFRLIDRKEKMSQDEWKSYASDLGLNSKQFDSLVRILEDKDAWAQSDELVQLFQAVEALGISDFILYDPTIIRGLDYYTGTVFEARDLSGDKRAILGGGRYDDLVADVGGDPLPGVGFAMGDVVIQLTMEELGLVPNFRVNPAEIFVPTFDENLMDATLSLASELRLAGFKVEWFPQADRLQKQFRYADHQGIPIVVIIGPDEISNHEVAIKDLRSGKQESIKRENMIQYLNDLLEDKG